MTAIASRALAALFALLAILVAQAVPLAAQESAADRRFAEQLGFPFQSGLVGAENAPVFAWVIDEGGVRNIWVARAGEPARRITGYTEDDGIQISGLALDANGTKLVFVRGGDADEPDASLPNPGLALTAPRQTLNVIDVAGAALPSLIGEGHGAVFAPDGSTLAYTSKGAIYLWSPDGKPRKLAQLDGRVAEMVWSPDGRKLAFQENRQGQSLVGVIDLAVGRLGYLGTAFAYAEDPAFSPDGSEVAFIQYREPPAELEDSRASFWSVVAADVSSGAIRTVWQAPEGEGGQFYGTRGRNLFWLDGGQILFPWERTGWLHVYAVDAKDGGAARDLTPSANEVENFRPAPDGTWIAYTANPGDLDSRRMLRVDIASGKTDSLTGPEVFAYYPVFGGDRLAATVTDAQTPAHMVLLDAMQLLGPKHGTPGYQTPENVTFSAADGLQVHGQLFRGTGAGKRPALVYVHGGPRRQLLAGYSPMYYYSLAYAVNQELAARGFTVLSVNYRSGTNYGRAFREAPEKARAGASEYRDVQAAGKWLAARSDVDEERIGIWGGSWGGYLTALALARDSDLFKAGVDLHGVHQMVRPVAETFSPTERLRQQQLQWDSSPMGAIGTWRSPVLLIHGDDDYNVPYGQSLLLARELTARGVPFEELAFPNERHDFFRFANWLTSYRATIDFFERKLGDGR